MLRKALITLYLFFKKMVYIYEVNHIPSKSTVRKVQAVRKKDVIKVAFVIDDIAKWKSESLYLMMLKHSRFNPVLVIVQKRVSDYLRSAQEMLLVIDYVEKKGYDYVIGNPNIAIGRLVNPDIVFWADMYYGDTDSAYLFCKNKNILSCYVPYCFHNTIDKKIDDLETENLVWKQFFENQSCVDDLRPVMRNHCINGVATGLPLNDAFLNFIGEDVWKKQDKKKIRIIWAPSHTIPGANNAYEQSTFLDIADKMLTLAEKYRDVVQWAFKPHPVLKRKLYEQWGREKTDAYYHKWQNMDNSQLEEGVYLSLFMNSDAMIHDCMSFLVEYMFTEKPVLFLDNGKDVTSLYNTQTQEAYNLHYHGLTVKDIVCFMENIRKGIDPLQTNRKNYKNKYLIPPHGKSASDNIIDVILGNV